MEKNLGDAGGGNTALAPAHLAAIVAAPPLGALGVGVVRVTALLAPGPGP